MGSFQLLDARIAELVKNRNNKVFSSMQLVAASIPSGQYDALTRLPSQAH